MAAGTWPCQAITWEETWGSCGLQPKFCSCDPEGAVSIIYRKEIAEADDPKKEYKDRLARSSKSWERWRNEWEGWSGQDYIHPKETTRSKIIKTLRLLEGKTVEISFRKHDNMPL